MAANNAGNHPDPDRFLRFDFEEYLEKKQAREDEERRRRLAREEEKRRKEDLERQLKATREEKAGLQHQHLACEQMQEYIKAQLYYLQCQQNYHVWLQRSLRSRLQSLRERERTLRRDQRRLERASSQGSCSTP